MELRYKVREWRALGNDRAGRVGNERAFAIRTVRSYSQALPWCRWGNGVDGSRQGLVCRHGCNGGVECSSVKCLDRGGCSGRCRRGLFDQLQLIDQDDSARYDTGAGF